MIGNIALLMVCHILSNKGVTLIDSTDDLPVIRDNIRKGFIETQSKVNSFINNLKKRIDGDDEEGSLRPPARTATGYSSGQTQQQYGGRRSGDVGRRSGDRDRYDADPQVIGDDFDTLHMHDETSE